MIKKMNRLLKLTKWIILLLLTCNGIAQSQDESIERKIDSLFQKYNAETAGVAVGVVINGKLAFEKGYGMANLEYDIPITPKTVFHVASVSKQFTAFSIYLLESQSEISFDDDIRKYIPEIPDFGKTIKIKHLLYHTSGLRDQWGILALAGWRMDDVITTEQILNLVSQQKDLNFETGSDFSYSNTGYTLLAEIVKRVSGQSFSKFTQKNIFKPLGMENTQFYDNYEKIVKNRAYSYELENGVFEKRKLNYSNVGPTSLFTTVEDLSKWAVNFENPRVGDASLIDTFNDLAKLDNGEPAILTVLNGETIYHAKGQFFRNYRGLPLYNHTGGDAGFRSYLVRFPENKLSIILLSNESDFDRLGNGLAIAEFYLKDKLQPIGTKKNQSLKDEPIEQFKSNLSDFVGEYYSQELATKYQLKIKGSKLVMTHRRLSDIELYRIGENKFSGVNYFPFTMEFLNTNNKVSELKISNFGAKNVKFERIK